MHLPQRLKVPINLEDHIQGTLAARVTLLEYGDYECPHCGQAYRTIKALQEHFGEDLRFVYRHFPLVEIHRMAQPAAETAEFAGTNGRFWPMHDLLFENQEQLSPTLLAALTNVLDLNTQELAAAVEQLVFTQRVRRDMTGGLQSGVHRTPTFFINGVEHVRAYDFEELADAIEQQMPAGWRRAG